jgi:hypothetical protein
LLISKKDTKKRSKNTTFFTPFQSFLFKFLGDFFSALRFGGPHLIVDSKNKSGSYRIQTTKENIDKFAKELTKLDIITIRTGM